MMRPEDIRAFRDKFDLSRDDLARILETDQHTIKRMEMPRDAKSYRKPAARMVRLMCAYAAGYRPTDWKG